MATSTGSEQAMSPDWVFSPDSNASVARDLGWFISYTPFTSHLDSFIVDAEMPVVGIGSVRIPVDLGGLFTFNAIVIDDVLHAPAAICNALGQGDFMDRYEIFSSSREGGEHRIRDQTGGTVATFDKTKSKFCLKLSKPPRGPVTTPPRFVDLDAEFHINAQWPCSERTRWDSMKPDYSAEKAWLKENSQDEIRFLEGFGLLIEKAEDREEGRAIIRQKMRHNVGHIILV